MRKMLIHTLYIQYFIHSILHTFNTLFIHSILYSFIQYFIHSTFHSILHSFIQCFIQYLFYSFIHSFIYSIFHSPYSVSGWVNKKGEAGEMEAFTNSVSGRTVFLNRMTSFCHPALSVHAQLPLVQERTRRWIYVSCQGFVLKCYAYWFQKH